MRLAPSIQLTKTEQSQLQQWALGRRTPVRLVLRAKIVLLAAKRHDNQSIALTVGTSRQTVGLWRQRFSSHRLPGLTQDAPRGGRPPAVRQALQERIVTTTLPPPTGGHALVPPDVGSPSRHQCFLGPTSLESPWAEAPLGAHLQAQSGSSVP